MRHLTYVTADQSMDFLLAETKLNENKNNTLPNLELELAQLKRSCMGKVQEKKSKTTTQLLGIRHEMPDSFIVYMQPYIKQWNPG